MISDYTTASEWNTIQHNICLFEYKNQHQGTEWNTREVVYIQHILTFLPFRNCIKKNWYHNFVQNTEHNSIDSDPLQAQSFTSKHHENAIKLVRSSNSKKGSQLNRGQIITKVPLWMYYVRQFRQWHYWCFDIFSTEVCSLGSDWWEVIIGLDNGLALNRFDDLSWALLMEKA